MWKSELWKSKLWKSKKIGRNLNLLKYKVWKSKFEIWKRKVEKDFAISPVTRHIETSERNAKSGNELYLFRKIDCDSYWPFWISRFPYFRNCISRLGFSTLRFQIRVFDLSRFHNTIRATSPRNCWEKYFNIICDNFADWLFEKKTHISVSLNNVGWFSFSW